jgi:hypothetical protein
MRGALASTAPVSRGTDCLKLTPLGTAVLFKQYAAVRWLARFGGDATNCGDEVCCGAKWLMRFLMQVSPQVASSIVHLVVKDMSLNDDKVVNALQEMKVAVGDTFTRLCDSKDKARKTVRDCNPSCMTV